MRTFTTAVLLLCLTVSAQAANPIHFIKHHKKITAVTAAAGGLALGLLVRGQQNQATWPKAKGGPVYCIPATTCSR
jgi:hypothetical protein